MESLRAAYPIPFTGMEPAVKPAAALTRSGVVGVLATEASLAGEKYLRLVNSHAASLRLITRPCPEFVELVEAGILDGAEAGAAVVCLPPPRGRRCGRAGAARITLFSDLSWSGSSVPTLP
ncbi:MAG: hypothetical protein R3F31_10505 [Verrucomicrobiales bacterium]